jgi:hypothetical protein
VQKKQLSIDINMSTIDTPSLRELNSYADEAGIDINVSAIVTSNLLGPNSYAGKAVGYWHERLLRCCRFRTHFRRNCARFSIMQLLFVERELEIRSDEPK